MPALIEQFPDLLEDIALCVGGLDEKTPNLALKPGRAIVRAGYNYEAVVSPGGGYQRIAGYERFDGRSPKPADAVYAIQQIEEFESVPSVGTTLIGASSGATGKIIAVVNNGAYANKLSFAENLSGIRWSLEQATVTPNTVTAPDDTTTADKLVEDATAASYHRISQVITNLALADLAVSIYAKAAERTKFQLQITDLGADNVYAEFDLVAETVSLNNAAGHGTIAGTITEDADHPGWYRCTISWDEPPVDPSIYLYLVAASNTYNGDGSSGMYFWGAQAESGLTATSYVTRTNAVVNYLVLTQTTGVFSLNELVQIAGPTTIGAVAMPTAVITNEQNAQYLNLAADVYRALIAAVPGTGPIRGVFGLTVGGTLKKYAFRDESTGTICKLYEATAAGWTEVAYFDELYFENGSGTEPAEGTVLTQGAHAATLLRLVTESGSWAAGTAQGRFIVDITANGFTTGALSVGATADLIDGPDGFVEQEIQDYMATGGRFEVVVRNFGGQLTTTRAYGCDGVNRGWEFDGTVFVPIRTGATVDKPKHVCAHLRHLFFMIGSSLLISGPGTPYKFNAVDGAAEIAMGDEGTGMLSLPTSSANATLMVQRRNSTGILYGSSAAGSDAWRLFDFNNEVGGLHYSQQVIADAYFLDDPGVLSLRAAAELSGFTPATLTQHLQDFMASKRGFFLSSCTHKTKSQYRLFFRDGSALWLTLANGKLVGAMPMSFPQGMNVVWSGEEASGEEITLAGSLVDGFVYQLDRGTSFDGEDINARMQLAWNPIKSPRIVKSYRRASLEITSSFWAQIQVSHRVGYGQTKYAQPGEQTVDNNFSGNVFWDAMTWDAFFWDGNTLSPTEVQLTGNGENIEIAIASGTDYINPYTVNSIIVLFFPRRRIR